MSISSHELFCRVGSPPINQLCGLLEATWCSETGHTPGARAGQASLKPVTGEGSRVPDAHLSGSVWKCAIDNRELSSASEEPSSSIRVFLGSELLLWDSSD